MSQATPGPAVDLALRSRRMVTPEGERVGAVLVRNGRVVTSVLMPGLVDRHVHVNEPGRTEREGSASAPRAAAARHVFAREVASRGPFTHVRLRIYPDGGVSRLRLHGRVEAP